MAENYLKNIASNLAWICLCLFIITLNSCNISQVAYELHQQNIILEKDCKCELKNKVKVK